MAGRSHSFRTDRALFDQLHGLMAPLLLMMATLTFVAWLIRRDAVGLMPAP